jgi:hypothetical protein
MRTSDTEKLQNLLRSYCTDETVSDKDGIPHQVLDAGRLYANKGLVEKYFKSAQRVEPVYEWHPKAGDRIPLSEPITAQGDETVFIKKLGEGKLKIYIPADPSGPLKASVLAEKYEAGDSVSDPEILTVLPADAIITMRKPRPSPIVILHECITRPTVIRGARDGKDQFMKSGDSLKFEDGACLPLPKSELDTAWQVTQKSLQI